MRTACTPIPDASESDVLWELMRSSSRTQTALSKAVGSAQSTLSAIPAGEREMTKSHMSALAKFFNIWPVGLRRRGGRFGETKKLAACEPGPAPSQGCEKGPRVGLVGLITRWICFTMERQGAETSSPPDRLTIAWSRPAEMSSAMGRTLPSPARAWNTSPPSRDRGLREVSRGDCPSPAPNPV